MRDKADPGKTFEMRKGIDQHPGWEGVQMDPDPGSIPPNALALGVNIRFDGGNVRSRLGIRSVTSLPTFTTTALWASVPQEAIMWLGMHHMQFRAPKLWIGAAGCLGAGTSKGAFVRWHNPDKSPATETAGNFVAESNRPPSLGSFGGNMYFGDWALLARPNVIEEPRAAITPVNFRESFSQQVVGYPGYDTTAMQEFDAKLFLALKDPAGAASKVGYWDGITLVTSDLSTTTLNGVNFCVWRDGKLVMVQSGSATVQIRTAGGSWSSVALPGSIANDYKNSLVEFRDSIYVASGTNAVWKISTYDTPATSVARTLTAGWEVFGLATLGDNLYYLSRRWDGVDYEAYIGLYEPDAAAGNWVDSYKRFDADVSTDFRATPGPITLTSYRNRLYAGGGKGIVATHEMAFDPTSTWYEAVPTSGTNGASVLRVG